jgi:hypothetical protein
MPRAPKHCGYQGCTEVGECATHKAMRQARANTTSRGYGWRHQQTRAALAPKAAGTTCALCGQPIEAGQAVHLDHSTPLGIDRASKGDRMVHARCNASAGGELGGAIWLRPRAADERGGVPRTRPTAP